MGYIHVIFQISGHRQGAQAARASAGDIGFPDQRGGHARRWTRQDQISNSIRDVQHSLEWFLVTTGNFS